MSLHSSYNWTKPNEAYSKNKTITITYTKLGGPVPELSLAASIDLKHVRYSTPQM